MRLKVLFIQFARLIFLFEKFEYKRMIILSRESFIIGNNKREVIKIIYTIHIYACQWCWTTALLGYHKFMMFAKPCRCVCRHLFYWIFNFSHFLYHYFSLISLSFISVRSKNVWKKKMLVKNHNGEKQTI